MDTWINLISRLTRAQICIKIYIYIYRHVLHKYGYLLKWELLFFPRMAFHRYRWISMNEIVEGSLEVKLPTIWTHEKRRWKGSERRERLEERRVEEKESEERRCRCAKRKESRETLCFSTDLWLRRVEK